MEVNIRTKNIVINPEVKQLLDKKLTLLKRLLGGLSEKLIEVRIELSKPSRHHRSGRIYYAEVNLRVPDKLLRADTRHYSLIEAINETFQELTSQVRKYKNLRVAKPRTTSG